jgi:hypothetical protein
VDADGRWGVARLVAQREAERRAGGPVDAAAVPDARASEDVANPPARDDDPAQGADAGPAAADSPEDTATADVPAEEGTADGEVEDAIVEGASAGDETADPATDLPADDAPEPEDVPPPRAPRPPEPAVPPSPRPPLRTPLVPRPPLPAPRRPHGVVRSGPVVPNASDARAARPRVEPDPSLFGFARHTRGRLGARVYTLFFMLVFALIIVQTIASIV